MVHVCKTLHEVSGSVSTVDMGNRHACTAGVYAALVIRSESVHVVDGGHSDVHFFKNTLNNKQPV